MTVWGGVKVAKRQGEDSGHGWPSSTGGCEMLEHELRAQLDRIERLLMEQKIVKDFYSIEEFAARVGKAVFTCQEWCRRGRITAMKKRSGRGKFFAWAVPHDELLRYETEGLLPERRVV